MEAMTHAVTRALWAIAAFFNATRGRSRGTLSPCFLSATLNRAAEEGA
jgi:hypothetical protein